LTPACPSHHSWRFSTTAAVAWSTHIRTRRHVFCVCAFRGRIVDLKKAIILNMSFLGIIAVALAICQTAYAITLQEGMADKEKYIFYDTSPFNVGMHAGLALLITYGILGTFTPTVMIITKILEKRRQRRKRTMSH
uniref:G_PROTEIN_RECEP_F1_2 domain-containing protein n=1 Tax=Mesocestoides corti TaxID=53468 RepID=A0A5K3FEE8_MESCO